jgi:hypothetical protein
VALLFLLLLTSSAPAAHVQVAVQDFTSGSVTNRRVTMTPLAYPTPTPGWVVNMEPKVAFTGTDGCLTYSNLLAGTYRLSISGTPVTSFQITVPDTNTLMTAASLLTTAVPANQVVYTTTASDARYVLLSDITNIILTLAGTAPPTATSQTADSETLSADSETLTADAY